MSPAEDRRAVVVVGSVHMDLIAHADRLPDPGESVSGGRFTMAAGGKAGNQAAQLARLGVPTFVVTRLGADDFGRALLRTLADAGIDTRYVAIDPMQATGASTVFAADGDYSSIIAPGAAAALDDADIHAVEPLLPSVAAVVLQLELPVDRALVAADLAHLRGARVVLNASPAPATLDEAIQRLLERTDVLVVNRVEAARLLRRPVRTDRTEWVALALRGAFGIERVVVTLGGEGAVAVGPDGVWRQPSFPADVVDAVGAGDAFLGVLVAGLVTDAPTDVALRAAAAAGAIVVGRLGGLAALPTRAEIDDYLAARPDTSVTDRRDFDA